ncbi:integrin alpha-5-like [Penaeus indicus]|uniref:integrin alpha-5-like n=1 Tax=Penaeus indicus TaxID=29960 RepID=UPI00300C496D
MASPQRLVWAQAVLGLAAAFNLNAHLARVLTGPEGTHFGYAVALWADRNDSLSLVVGAPRAASPANGSLPLGRIHVCPPFGDQCPPDALAPLPTQQGETEAAVRSSHVLSAQGTGFGETLFAADRRRSMLLACAPRFLMRPHPDSLHSRGACVVVEEAAAPPHAALSIVPFRAHYFRVGGGPRKNNHRYTGFGMAGFSAALDAAQDSVFLGGPYAFFGQGVVARSSARGRAEEALSRANFGPPALDFSGEGWATVLGRFDGLTEMVATSAPNADHARGSIAFYEAASLRPATVPRLAGSGLASKFGFSLAAGDWDGDGATDLAAGAPLAHDGKGAPDAGAVYVYYAPAKTVSPRPALEVQGRTAWARFGHALACLGDIDRDGFDDLAVGAPFDGDGGSVHVFHGRREGLGAEPTQVLRASDFDGALRGFGFSIDGGIDMDNNAHPGLTSSRRKKEVNFLHSGGLGVPFDDPVWRSADAPERRRVLHESHVLGLVSLLLLLPGGRTARQLCRRYDFAFALELDVTAHSTSTDDSIAVTFLGLLPGKASASEADGRELDPRKAKRERLTRGRSDAMPQGESQDECHSEERSLGEMAKALEALLWDLPQSR